VTHSERQRNFEYFNRKVFANQTLVLLRTNTLLAFNTLYGRLRSRQDGVRCVHQEGQLSRLFLLCPNDGKCFNSMVLHD